MIINMIDNLYKKTNFALPHFCFYVCCKKLVLITNFLSKMQSKKLNTETWTMISIVTKFS